MSETQSRESSNLSKYDAMTSQQLQELLRLDSETPNNGGTDTEEILYIMEVLAERKKDSFSEKKALESWESFQRDYLDTQDEEDVPNVIPMPSRKRSWVRRWAAAAAAVVLLIGIPIGVVAMNSGKLWDAKLIWHNGHFCFEKEKPAIPTKDNRVFLQELSDHGMDPSIVPSRILDRYVLKKIDVHESSEKNSLVATYTNCESDQGDLLVISVDVFMPSNPGRAEANEGILEVYEGNGVEYYIVRNNNRLKALWLTGPYKCFISGNLTIEEIKVMIDSIGKG